jgi:hypothetical protein
MNKNLIKDELKKLVSEEVVSGEKVTKQTQKVSKESNKAYYKDVEKKMADYDKNLKTEDDDAIDPVMNNYEGSEKEYHDEMEIRNGMEMNQYDREPSEKFKDRAKKALEGDSTMGNKTYTGKENGNTEEVWGASGGKHIGKEIAKAAAASAKKRADAVPSMTSFGDDIEMTNGNGKKVSARKIATESISKEELRLAEAITVDIKDGTKIQNVNSNQTYTVTRKQGNTVYASDNRGKLVTIDSKAFDSYKIMESIKRIKFKKPFDGVGNAIRLIPEAFKVNNKEFELTDGNENYRIKWKGTLSEGRATILSASDKNMVNESYAKIKHLMGYRSETTLGTPTASDRVNENKNIKAGMSQGFVGEDDIKEYGDGGLPYDTGWDDDDDEDEDDDTLKETQDPEDKHWEDQATYNERHSGQDDDEGDYDDE